MREFGWYIEYTLGLSFPVFVDLFELIRKARADAAIDGVYLPYAAAKYGGKASKRLHELADCLYLDAAKKKAPSVVVTKRQIDKSARQFQAYIDAMNSKLASAASGC